MFASLLLATTVALASQASAACDRAKLKEATESYLKAQAVGNPGLLQNYHPEPQADHSVYGYHFDDR